MVGSPHDPPEKNPVLEQVQVVLGWCALVNYGVLVVWWLIFVYAHGWMYQFNSEFFQISERDFDNTHYLCMGLYKLAIFLFLLVPYLVLRWAV